MRTLFTTLSCIVLFASLALGQTQLGSDITSGVMDATLFGEQVATSDDGSRVAILGDQGSEDAIVQVYEWQNNAWTQIGATITGDAANLITAIAFSGDGTTLAVGIDEIAADPSDADSGIVRVYTFTGGNWSQKGNTIRNGEENFFGAELSISSDGNRVASSIEDDTRADFVVYEFANNMWTQLGSNVSVQLMGGPTVGDTDVAISNDGQHLAISLTSGAASDYRLGVYEWSNNSWTQRGSDINLDGDFVNRTSAEIDLSADGSRMAAGFYASGANDSEKGWAIVYEYTNMTWTVLGDTIKGKADGDNLGTSIAISNDGTIVAVGADQAESVMNLGEGYVQVYQIQNNAWAQVGMDIMDGGDDEDYTGEAMALSGDAQRIVVPSPNSGMDETGKVQVYDLSALLTSISDGFAQTVSAQVFPNPTRDITRFVLESEANSQVSLSIVNAVGQVVARPYAGNISANQSLEISFDASSLATGMYTYRLSFDDGSQQVGKFIKVN